MHKITIDELAAFCKRKGLVYQSSEIYGGLSGFFDFGPLGVDLFGNIKQDWWRYFVSQKENMAGIDASIISHPRVWKASGHVDNFGDLVLSCNKCLSKFRADHFIEDTLKINSDGLKAGEINKLISQHQLKCPKCKGSFEELRSFNLLFRTTVGAEEAKSSAAYLRGETAQAMFTDFKLVVETSRKKLPFGIAQVGKCFRNEIAPRDFMFRSREFTIAEFEFFIHPEDDTCDLLTEKHLGLKVMLLDAQTQQEGGKELKETTIGKMIHDRRLGNWHAYWLAEQMMWLYSIGLEKEDLKVREHVKTELSHYSSATFDIDYLFPFGSKEIAGNANRGQYDLTQHINESKENLEIFDESKKQKVRPRVIEPTFGMERVFMAVLVCSYNNDLSRGNIVLKLPPRIAPVKAGIFPLVNKPELISKAREIFSELNKEFCCSYDQSGSVGRRYARNDEIGTPYCITVDFDGLSDDTVTIRDRDSTNQVRVKSGIIRETIRKLVNGDISFEHSGKAVN